MEKRTLGTFIAVLRKAKGLTQRQLAEMLNVSDKAVSRWERNECAPDLSVIPVLADIFDISVDELLRGQRKQPEEPLTNYETQKSEKQLRYLLKKKAADFGIRTCASFALSMFGLIAAMICNLGFLRAYIGFFVGCLFYTLAILCQTVSLITGLHGLDSEDLEEDTKVPRRTMLLLSELSVSITVCLTAATLPLLILVNDTYAGLSSASWAVYGLLWGAMAAVICLAVCILINRRMGYQTFPGLSTPKNKLRIRAALILAAALFITASAHGFFAQLQYMNLHELTAATRWDTWEDLKEYLETPVRNDGAPLKLVSTKNTGYVNIGTYIAPDGAYTDIADHNYVLVYEDDMITPKYACIRRNQFVVRFYYSDTEDRLPIYTLDDQQLADAEKNWHIIHICVSSIYVVEIVAAIILYRRKAGQLTGK